MTDYERPEQAILAANERFYRAFNEADVAAMSALWATRAPVACLHPGEPLVVGRQQVLHRWREILSMSQAFKLRCDRPTVQVLGTTALVYCYEGVGDEAAHLAATNVFVFEDGSWRMVHHHAGPLANPLPAATNSSLN